MPVKEEPKAAVDVQTQQPVREEPVVAKPVSESIVVSPEPVIPASEEVPLRLCTMLQDGEGARAGLIDNRTGQTMMAKEGDTVGGYEIVKLDVQNEKAIVRKDGREYSIGITGNASAAGTSPLPAVATKAIPPPNLPAMEPPPAGEFPEQIDFSAMPPPPKYEPTPEEKAAGIDPNDPATWPASYRGPGIERAIQDQRIKESP